jgi:hypothetical protein
MYATQRLSLRADVDFTALAESIDRTGTSPVLVDGQQLWQLMGGLGYRLTPAGSALNFDAYLGCGLAHFAQHGEGSNDLDLAGGVRLGTPISSHSDVALRSVVHRMGSIDGRPRVVNQVQLAVSYRR